MSKVASFLRPTFDLTRIFCVVALTFIATGAIAQTPSLTLLVLAKSDNTVAVVDPTTLQVLARIPSGPGPHEIIASDDGKRAYISNYGGVDSSLNTISVVDLVARKALPPIDLGALHSTHGLDFASGKLYFTAETNKVIGRYDPASKKVDWVLGTGQDRTHMIVVTKDHKDIITSNVNSATISMIEHVEPASGGFRPPQGAPRKTWEVTNIPAGNGVEGFDVSPDGKEIWAANARDATVTIIDVATKKAVQSLPIPVKIANRLKFTPDGQHVLISALGAGSGDTSLLVMDASTRKEVKQLKLGGGAAGILMAPDGSRAFVAVSSNDKVAVVDLKTLEVVGEISAGKQPDGMAWAVRK
ncbi:MAG TPA: cytochrome D1 domain-containing protein [Candidatus Sulfotelmatobacter sp.]|jgi:YVTN family beta-propeller protein|nr:cytochrome D1 domain-containing protein [Candidatus Sulfotelmatobacter sp.]